MPKVEPNRPFLSRNGPDTSGVRGATTADASIAAMRERWEAEVLELVRRGGEGYGRHLVVQLGIGKEERHFWRTAETLQIVGLALPHLSPQVNAEAVAYLDRLVEAGARNHRAGCPCGCRHRANRLTWAPRSSSSWRETRVRRSASKTHTACGPTRNMPTVGRPYCGR